MQKSFSSVVQEAELIEKAIAKERSSSEAEVNHILHFTTQLSQRFKSFAEELDISSIHFFNGLDDHQPQHIKSDLDWLETITNEVLQKFRHISKDIIELVVVPISLFAPGLSTLHEDLREKAALLRRIVLSDCEGEDLETPNPTSCLGYEGLIMSRKRSTSMMDITQSQSKCAELMRELDQVYTNKCKTFRSACQHLSGVLNSITNIKEVEDILEKNSSMEWLRSKEAIDSLSKVMAGSIKKKLGTAKLFQMMEKNGKLESSDPEELLVDIRIRRYIDSLMGTKVSRDSSIRTVILESFQNINTFLSVLNHKVMTQMDLEPPQFKELVDTMNQITSKALTSEENAELVHHILSVSLRIHSQDKSLIRELGKQVNKQVDKQVDKHVDKQVDKQGSQWQNPHIWSRIFKYLRQEISRHQTQMGSFSKSSRKSPKKKSFIGEGFSKLWLMVGRETPKLSNQEQTSLQIIKEINNMICQLEVPTQQAVKIVIGLCRSEKISDFNVENIMKVQTKINKVELDRNYLDTEKTKMRREQKLKHGYLHKNIVCLKYTLKYLQAKDKMELLLVSKEWSQNLTNAVNKSFLIRTGDLAVVGKYRVPLYKHLLSSGKYTKEEYVALVSQLPKCYPTRETVSQDAKRCLKWAIQFQPQLQQILATYSFQHPETKYVQGMHCLCEHLFHISSESHEVYGMFETLMEVYFVDNFKLSFEKLKLRIYQYSRILEINYPKLAGHFLREGLEAEHYIFPWAVTLWGDKQGDIVDILWDGFVVDGWKWWIKVCVWLVSLYQKQFLLLNFDSILKHINGEMEQQLLNQRLDQFKNSGIDKDKVKGMIDRIKVSDTLLKEIKKEFEYSDYNLLPVLVQELSNS